MDIFPRTVGPKELVLPVASLREGVVFPSVETVLNFGRPKSVAALEAAFKSDKLLCVFSQKDGRILEPGEKDLYQIGTLIKVTRMMQADNGLQPWVKGLVRVKLVSIEATNPFLIGKIERVNIPPADLKLSREMKTYSKVVLENFQKAISLGKSVDVLTIMHVMGENNPAILANRIAYALEIETAAKQEILETLSVEKRLKKVGELLTQEIQVLEMEHSIRDKTQQRFDKSMREAFLRERKRTIEEELGEGEGEESEIKQLEKKIKGAGLTKEAKKKAQNELKRLARLNVAHPEYGYIRNYLDWLIDLPWSKSTPNNVGINKAARVLEKDHYGLKKVKERIVESLAVMKLLEKQNKRKTNKTESESGPTIMCFVGPPGVGKTSIGKSIAKSLGRKFIRISLGGVHDEAEIRGHRRTYIGSLPGRIIQGMKETKSNNPVFMLDEIDKLGRDFRGDPASALLEALDPEQNNSFVDHYLEVPFDLSRVMFITTGNMLETIPPALRDRMEVIRFSGYTEFEKFNIAKKYLWQKQLRSHGLIGEGFKISDIALREIIRFYTREAGVRNLERSLATICRKIARQMADKKGKVINKDKPISDKQLKRFLGPRKFSSTLKEKKDQVGLATGLAYNAFGGDTMPIEVALMPGKGQVILTGKLGKVLQESARAALSFVRANWKMFKLDKDFYKDVDIHIHLPEGAIPKDGPSAGVAITTALVSAFTKRKVKNDVCMTGEITLRGRVLEIGGVKEKVLSAHRTGLKTVIMPKENKKDLEEIPPKVKNDLKFVFVDKLGDALKVALVS